MAQPAPAPGAPVASWPAVLAATFVMQVTIVVAVRALAVLGPAVTGAVGLPPEAIGYLTGTGAVGTVLYLLAGGPVLARLGPVRTLQAGAALAAAALLLSAQGVLAALFLGALLVGLGNGPTMPAGTRILARSVPADHRTLIFSAKMAGAPLGGTLAALMLPAVAFHYGWAAALIIVSLMVIASAAAVQRLRSALDAERDVARPIGLRALLARDNLARPFAALRSHPALAPLTAISISFAVVQACLLAFTVTLLSAAHGFGLAEAAALLAAVEFGGFGARLALGWLVDRTGAPVPTILLLLLGAAMSSAALALLPGLVPGVAMFGIAMAAGACGTGWQGIILAEFARVAPPETIGDATAGATLCCFLAYFIGPAAFAGVVWFSGDFTLAMLLVAAQAVAATAVLAPRLLRQAGAAPRHLAP